eukprot:7002820-Pyramimonas_sp.AAC.1
MLTSLLRLALALGICSHPSCDWLSLWAYAHIPPVIGSHFGHMLALWSVFSLRTPPAPRGHPGLGDGWCDTVTEC